MLGGVLGLDRILPSLPCGFTGSCSPVCKTSHALDGSIGSTPCVYPGYCPPLSRRRNRDKWVFAQNNGLNGIRRMLTVEFLLVSWTRMIEGHHDFHRGAWTQGCSLQLRSSCLLWELANEAFFVWALESLQNSLRREINKWPCLLPPDKSSWWNMQSVFLLFSLFLLPQ